MTRALAEYEGSLVLVSHDRSLLRTVCDSFLLVVDGRATPFDGDIDDYLTWLTARREQTGAVSLPAEQAAQRENRKAQRDSVAAERQQRLAQRRPLAREAEKLEARIAKLEKEREQLETQLADMEFYARTSATEVHAPNRRCTEVINEIGVAEERWLEVHAELEAIGAA